MLTKKEYEQLELAIRCMHGQKLLSEMYVPRTNILLMLKQYTEEGDTIHFAPTEKTEAIVKWYLENDPEWKDAREEEVITMLIERGIAKVQQESLDSEDPFDKEFADAFEEDRKNAAAMHVAEGLADTLGEDLLARLMHMPLQSMMNKDNEEHLLFLKKIVSNVQCGYLPDAVRSWFTRPRSELSSRAPEDMFEPEWKIIDGGPQMVYSLSTYLSQEWEPK
jgi:hypothetical protein